MDVPTKCALDIYDDWQLLHRLKWLRNSILAAIALMWITIIFILPTWHPLSWDHLFTGKAWTLIWGFAAIFTLAIGYHIVTIQRRITNLIKNYQGGMPTTKSKATSIIVIILLLAWAAVLVLIPWHPQELNKYFKGPPLIILFLIMLLITGGVVHYISPVDRKNPNYPNNPAIKIK